MVSFTENPENYDTVDTVRLLDSQLREAIALERKLGEFDKELAGDPRYIERVSVTHTHTHTHTHTYTRAHTRTHTHTHTHTH